MPGMLTIVIAQLTASEVFGKQSLFISMLRSNGLDYDINPVMQVLRGIGVASVLDNNTARFTQTISHENATSLIEGDSATNWLLLNNKDGGLVMLMPISELAKYLQITIAEDEGQTAAEEQEYNDIDLLEIPAKRLQLSPISLQANLQQAHDKFEQGAEALYVVFNEALSDENSRVYGIITKNMIEQAYKPKSSR